MIDLHLHTKASHDGLGSVSDYCEAAISKGISVIAITDHLDLDPGLTHSKSYKHAATLEEVTAARERYGSKITILAGVEVTYQSEHAEEITEILSGLEADLVIGSVHMVGGAENVISEEDGARNFFKDKESGREAYYPYFEEVFQAVKSGCFDIIGHIDGIKRYGSTMLEPLSFSALYGILRSIMEGMIKRDVALEVNTSGLYHPVEDIYPGRDILRLYRELGGTRLTLGSDAHEPADTGRGLDRAITLIKSLGFGSLTTFDRRMPRQAPL